ncbi:MAG: hypothetical protein JST40_12855 [Armatimonadetes bacterium]|nr:hypothetical protein [Armatimonadota bacterium]
MKNFDFEDIWPHLEPELRRLHVELQNALANAKELERTHPELASDPITFAGWVRAYLVKAMGIRIDDDPFALERGFNLSITIKSRAVSLRVNKAPVGKMPTPYSPGQLNFYNQDLGQYSFELDGTIPSREFAPNFVVKWSLDDSRNLCELELGYPKPTERSVLEKNVPQDWYWIEPAFDRTKPSWAHPDLFKEDEPVDLPGLTPAAECDIDAPSEDLPNVKEPKQDDTGEDETGTDAQ